MAKIRALQGWRYHENLASSIGELISPPFDVVTDQQREALYQHPFNSIHLSAPAGPAAVQHAVNTLQQWKKDKVICKDALPYIYVYYQYFRLPGEDHEYCRKGFICLIEASFWEENIVLRHEDTIPVSVRERENLLDATLLNASPTHGLYTDIRHELEPWMDEAMEQPVYETEDDLGVRNVLGIISSPWLISNFVNLMKDKQVILADGHHRYESSLTYRRKCMQQNPRHSGDELYNYHLMYLTNTEAEDIKVLPTHRLIKQVPVIAEKALLTRIRQYFSITPARDASQLSEVIAGKRWAFGLITKEHCYHIQLKPEAYQQFDTPLSEDLKQLDIVVLHHFFIEKVLGVPKEEQANSSSIQYERSVSQCRLKVSSNDAALAIITNGVSIDHIKEVCYSGHVLPQKSTYFYPKTISGFLFASIHENE